MTTATDTSLSAQQHVAIAGACPCCGSGQLQQIYALRDIPVHSCILMDSRDEATGDRLDNLEDPYRLFRCHTIMNCVDVCPKHLNPTQAIGKIKELMVRRAI